MLVFRAHTRALRRLGPDENDVGTEVRDAAKDLLLHARSQRHDDHHRSNTDENAKHRQRRTEFGADDRAESEPNCCKKRHHGVAT
jgi:hypothetical protein